MMSKDEQSFSIGPFSSRGLFYDKGCPQDKNLVLVAQVEISHAAIANNQAITRGKCNSPIVLSNI